MSRTYRVGVIGFAHMHVNHILDEFATLPNIEWVACADTLPTRPSTTTKRSSRQANLNHARQHVGIPKVYDDYREMLDHERFDAVIFCPENARHVQVCEALADKGIHMLTEKPMASDLSGALRMARAVRAAGVSLMVNWPSTWWPSIRKMKELIDQGAIGDVWEVKWRNGASMGPLAYGTGDDAFTDKEKGLEWWHYEAEGGGALLDYCCYGACLALWFLGTPAVACLGMRANLASHYGDAEDNAIITVRFPKALALLEATWTTWHVGVPTGPVVYGTRGTLVATTRPSGGGQSARIVEVYTSRGHGLTEPDQVFEEDPLPKGRATLAEEFIHHLETREPLHPTLQVEHNVRAMAILDAGRRSSISGRLEPVNDAVWSVG